MPVEQDALSFEDEDDVFWVGAVQDSCGFCTKELVGFVDFLKHVLKDEVEMKSVDSAMQALTYTSRQ